MPRRSAARVAIGAVLLPSIAFVPASASAASVGSVMAKRINKIRVAKGLPRLKVAPSLSVAARRHSVAQARTGSLTHSGFSQRIFGAGIRGVRTAGENVGYVSGCGHGTAAIIVRAWMRSPGHRQNILSPAFHMFGTGAAIRGRCGATFATVEFAG